MQKAQRKQTEFVERASNPPFEQEWLEPKWRVERLCVQVICAVLLEKVPLELDTPAAHLSFTSGLRHHEVDSGKLLSDETVMAARPFNDNWRSADRNRLCVWRQRQEWQVRQGQERQGPRQRKAKGKTRAVLSLKALVVTVESGDTSKKNCQYKNTVADLSNFHDPSHTTTSWFVFS